MLKQVLATGLTCLALAACGTNADISSNPTKAGDANQVGDPNQGGNPNKPSGTFHIIVSNLAFDKSAATLDPSFLQVTAKDAAQVVGGTATDLGTAKVDASRCGQDAAKPGLFQCKVDLDVNPNVLTQGLVIVTGDSRQSSGSPRWQATATLFTQDEVKATAATIATGVTTTAYAVTADEVAALATWAGADAGKLLDNGGILTQVLDNTGKPVAGAAVVPSAGYTVSYGDDTGAAKSANPVTGALGLALEVPAAKATALAAGWTVTPPQDSTQTWTVPATLAVPFTLTVHKAAAK